MEQLQITHLREIQTKLADDAEITSQDVQDMAMIVRLYPSMVHRSMFGLVSGRYQAQQAAAEPEETTERPTSEQLEAARKAAAANPTPKTIAVYATLKRQAGE
ncbi:hypothetical protein [Paenibacillus sp. DMB5]|uniref:hypothetical protein n=1 Tax=Paenibacillus sp. DMB5 TaxID=1780103 RepID=UPI00076C16A7|nr:hypothetical protein [Paenibacillus sp. DMB5]KUP26190.1 hypothetical protein AWJ19_25745 [Paenibacillus sp. DMB5]KUP26202.1 hypothetical protein AWJ19_25805 [Paenibacillus sp. DMB5]